MRRRRASNHPAQPAYVESIVTPCCRIIRVYPGFRKWGYQDIVLSEVMLIKARTVRPIWDYYMSKASAIVRDAHRRLHKKGHR